jgi:hypothetical protein
MSGLCQAVFFVRLVDVVANNLAPPTSPTRPRSWSGTTLWTHTHSVFDNRSRSSPQSSIGTGASCPPNVGLGGTAAATAWRHRRPCHTSSSSGAGGGRLIWTIEHHTALLLHMPHTHPLTSQVLTPCVFLPRSPYPGRYSTPPDDRLSVKPTYVGKNSYRRQRVYLKEVYNRFLYHIFRYNHPIQWSVMFKDIAFRYLDFVSMSLPRRNRWGRGLLFSARALHRENKY